MRADGTDAQPRASASRPHYGGSATRMHHEIEGFMATTVRRMADTTIVVVGKNLDCWLRSRVDRKVYHESGIKR